MEIRLRTNIEEIDVLFGPEKAMVNGETWIISHLPEHDALDVTKRLFRKADYDCGTDRAGVIGLFENRLGGASFGFRVTGWRYAIPHRSATEEQILNIVNAYRQQGIVVPAIVIDDRVLKFDLDDHRSYQDRICALRELGRVNNYITIILVTLSADASLLKRHTTYAEWMLAMPRGGYYLYDKRRDTYVDGELIVDMVDGDTEGIWVHLGKHRRVPRPASVPIFSKL